MALIDLLNQLAACVEGKAAGQQDTIRLAGFEPVEHANSSQVPLAKPELSSVLNLEAGKVQLHMKAQDVRTRFSWNITQQQQLLGNSAGGFPSGRNIVVPESHAGHFA